CSYRYFSSRMSRTFVLIIRWVAIEFQQCGIEPFALGDKTRMLVPQLVQALRRFFQLVWRRAPTAVARDIAFHALQFDFGAAPRALVPQLHFVVANDALDQLVPRNHPIPGTLQLRRFLGGDLSLASTGIHHSHYSRSIVWTETEHLAAHVLRDQNGAPMDAPVVQVVQRI